VKTNLALLVSDPPAPEPLPIDLDTELFAANDDLGSDDINPEVKRLRGILMALKTFIKQREKQSCTMATRLRVSEEQNQDLTRKLQAARAAGEELSRRVIDGRTALNQTEAALNDVRVEVKNLQSALDSTKREVATLASQLEATQKRHEKELRSANGRAAEELHTSRRETAYALEKVDALAKELEVLQAIRKVERDEADAERNAYARQLNNERLTHLATERSANLLREEVSTLLPTLKAAAGCR